MRTIKLRRIGRKHFPRWIIGSTDGFFWGGTEWVAKKSKALLYFNANEAGQDIECILKHEYGEKPFVANYVVPLAIEVRSDQQMGVDQIREWLQKASTFFVDYEKFSNGPSNALVVTSIKWEQIR